MGSFLRYLILALFIILLAAWLFTVARSCNTPSVTTPDSTETTIRDAGTETASANDDELEDLYEEEETDTEGGDADTEEKLPDNAQAADDLEMGNTGDPDEDPLPEETTGDGDTPGSISSNNGSVFGKYLVVAGTYLSEGNANIMAKKLEKKGYHAAEVFVFDLSQYYSVTAGRYETLNEARTVAKNLKAEGEEAYVHKMRGKRISQ